MHTEAKAKELWCPMVRAPNSTTARCAVNVAEEHGPDALQSTWSNCVASACAMWRWGEEPRFRHREECKDRHATIEPQRPPHVNPSWDFCPGEDDHACWLQPEEEAQKHRHGHCGLAGRPEVFGG